MAFSHPALFYSGDTEYIAGTLGFVQAGLDAREPVAVAVPPANLALVRSGLGADAARVRLLDMTQVGRNPGRIIPGVLRAFADRHPGPVRIIGEPIWPGRTADEYPACAQHEALINLAFEDREVTILCPYDVDGLDATVLADAEVTHPVLIDAAGEQGSDGYAPERIVATYNRSLPVPPEVATLPFDIVSFPAVRRLTVDVAERAGVPPDRLADIAVAVSELATNSIVHGGGHGTLRVWADTDHLICEVTDPGQLTDPLVGRRPAAPDCLSGRGMLLVNLVCDLVRTHTGPSGTTIRIYVRR
jgi:anti-sigma regulatory factor (Ser/Thr protein kinase)